MTEDEAYAAFLLWRWPAGRPRCTYCDHAEAYQISTLRRFKCKACLRQFSATTHTTFASRKMAFVSIMELLEIAGKASALEISRRLGCQYKTAYVAAQKRASANPSAWVGYWQKPRELRQ
jgi:transposase-like protein